MLTLFYIVGTAFFLVCVLLILLILIQKGRGGGLASAFGGGGAQQAFGAKTGDVLTWATSVVFGLFLILAVCLNLLANSVHAEQVEKTTIKAPAIPPANTTGNDALPGLDLPGRPAVSPTAPSTAAPTNEPAN